MRFAFIVCQNGLGHFKRTLLVVDALLHRYPKVSIDVFCEDWQLSKMFDEPAMERLANTSSVRFQTGVMEGSFQWSRDSAAYEGQDWLGWLEELASSEAFKRADAVVSDNLPEVLSLRPEAVLMGSFLWSEVLAEPAKASQALREYVQTLRSLLDAHRPAMLCVQDLVMPEVEELTRPVPLPWFTAKELLVPKVARPPYRVAFLGGATPAVREELARAADQVAEAKGWEVYLPGTFDARPRVKRFEYKPEFFRKMHLLVCRPGVGTLTDAVRYRIPVLALGEPENMEMTHNGQQVEALGMGVSLPTDELAHVPQVLEAMVEPAMYDRMVAALEQRPLGGAQAAARWLGKRFALD